MAIRIEFIKYRRAFLADATERMSLDSDNAIKATAWAIGRCTNKKDFARLVTRPPDGAIAYWQADVDDPEEREQRIINRTSTKT